MWWEISVACHILVLVLILPAGAGNLPVFANRPPPLAGNTTAVQQHWEVLKQHCQAENGEKPCVQPTAWELHQVSQRMCWTFWLCCCLSGCRFHQLPGKMPPKPELLGWGKVFQLLSSCLLCQGSLRAFLAPTLWREAAQHDPMVSKTRRQPKVSFRNETQGIF